jgi:hypothetical protein
MDVDKFLQFDHAESKSEYENTLSLKVFLKLLFVFWHFQSFLIYFTGIYRCVTGSDVLKSLFHVEMDIRN